MYYLHLHGRTGGAATLIRRDRVSGEQWDVANFCAVDTAPEGEVRVDMLQPGYARLAPAPATQADGSARSRVPRKPVPGTTAEAAAAAAEVPLTRVMRIEGKGFWGRIKERHKHAPGSERVKKHRDYVFDGIWRDAQGRSEGRLEFKGEAAGRYLKVRGAWRGVWAQC